MIPLKAPLVFFTCLLVVYCQDPINFRIGVIVDSTEDARENSEKFWSFSNNYQKNFTFVPLVENVPWMSTLLVSRKVCSLFSEGIDGLLSLLPPNMSPLLASYANTFGLPLITKWSAGIPKDSEFVSNVRMMPRTDSAVASLMEYYKWKSFTFIYDSDTGPLLLQKVLERKPEINALAMFRAMNADHASWYLRVLQNDPTDKDTSINVLCAINNGLLDEALAGTPITLEKRQQFHFISAEPLLRPEKMHFSSWHQVTKLSLVDFNSSTYSTLINRWRTIPALFRTSLSSTNAVPENAILSSDSIGVLSQSMFDLAKHVKSVGKKENNDYSVKHQCSSNPERHPLTRSISGAQYSNYLKKAVLERGVTGKVKFDEYGERADFLLHIYSTVSEVTQKVGVWSDYEGLQMTNDNSQNKELKDEPTDQNGKNDPSKKTLIVTAVYVSPYIMDSNTRGAKGNYRYNGFAVDLWDKVSSILGVNYEIRLAKDGKFGGFDGTNWTGMIGEVMRGEADTSIAPLTITRLREQVVDFTKPFMSLGLNILIKKPAAFQGKTSAKLSPFGFLSAFGYDTWLVTIALYLCFGAGFYVVSRYTGAPDRIRSVDTKGSDELSVCSSFWFATGSLFLQNTGIYPRSLSHRVLSIVWWIFSLVLITSFIGALGSMLIKERTKIHGPVDSYLTSFQLLKNFIETGTPAIGLVSSGSTMEFFKSSTVGIYHEYGKFLETNRGVITKSYREGIQRVRNSNGSYAFIMESTESAYASNHLPCDTIATSGFLDSRQYGMAVKKGSQLRESLDHALLTLMESGELRQLYEKWWHQEVECNDPNLDVLPGIYDNSLAMSEVSGAFYILIIGMAIASIAALTEYFIRSKQLPVLSDSS